ncbi:MAG: hypothetical protein AB7K24_04050 [Gemmataceae bacterium]
MYKQMLVAIVVLSCQAPAWAADAPLDHLSQEVVALHVLYNLQLDKPQLAKLKEIARKTVDTPGRRQPKGSDKLREILSKLRAALIRANDEELIDKLYAEYDQLIAKETPELDDDFEITDEARARAPEALKMMTPSQVAAYLAIFADTTPDPFEMLRQALTDVRGLNDEEWKNHRVQIAEEIGWMLHGVNVDRAEDAGNQAVQILIVARGLSGDDFKAKTPALEQKIRDLVGKTGPIEVLRHLMEYHLADLLSNPRLVAAIDEKLNVKD